MTNNIWDHYGTEEVIPITKMSKCPTTLEIEALHDGHYGYGDPILAGVVVKKLDSIYSLDYYKNYVNYRSVSFDNPETVSSEVAHHLEDEGPQAGKSIKKVDTTLTFTELFKLTEQIKSYYFNVQKSHNTLDPLTCVQLLHEQGLLNIPQVKEYNDR